jgi:hypothetical protein
LFLTHLDAAKLVTTVLNLAFMNPSNPTSNDALQKSGPGRNSLLGQIRRCAEGNQTGQNHISASRCPPTTSFPRAQSPLVVTLISRPVPAKNSENVKNLQRFRLAARNVADMFALISTVFSWLACRIRSRAELELELIALRHQVAVLNRQRVGRPRLCSVDRLV